MIMSRKSILTLVVMALCLTGWAKVRLPHLISENMVLQQQTDTDHYGHGRQRQKNNGAAYKSRNQQKNNQKRQINAGKQT